MLDLLFAKFVAVMRMVKEELVLVEQNPEAGTMAGLDLGAHVLEQGFDLAPLDVAADGVAKDRLE